MMIMTLVNNNSGIQNIYHEIAVLADCEYDKAKAVSFLIGF